MLNIASEPRRLEWNGKERLLLSTYMDREGEMFCNGSILRPDEGLVLEPCT